MFNKIKDFIYKKINKESSSIITSQPFNLNNIIIPPFNYINAQKLYKNWVAVAININASRLSTLPLRLYIRQPSSGRKVIWNTEQVSLEQKRYLNGCLDNKPSLSVLRKISDFNTGMLEVVDSHPVLTLINNVNNGFNQIDLIGAKIRDLQLTGNAYWYIVRDRFGIPSEIIPVASVNMKIITEGRGYEKKITGYKYGEGQDAIMYDYNDIIHFKRHSFADSIYAKGDLELGWDAVWIDNDEHQYKKAILQNMGRLDSIVSIPGANKIQLDRLKADYNNNFMGPQKAGKTGFLNSEVKVTPLNYSEMDLSQYDPSNIREIGAIFGVPEQKLIGNSPIKANSANQDLDWLRTTITSLANADEQKLNEHLLPMFGEEVVQNAFLAYDNPVRADQNFVVKRNVNYVKAGVITANEARKTEGMDSIDGGDELYIPKISNTSNNLDKSEDIIKSIIDIKNKENSSDKQPINININNSSNMEVEEENNNEEKIKDI